MTKGSDAQVPSPLSEDAEGRITSVIGCCIRVHRALGPGLLEHIYVRAMCIELGVSGLRFERERQFPVRYRDHVLCHQRLDLIVADEIVLELKAVERLAPIHHAQILSYLKVSGLRVGLLVNFNVPVIPEGLKRFVL
jgi:GxxExxY protein